MQTKKQSYIDIVKSPKKNWFNQAAANGVNKREGITLGLLTINKILNYKINKETDLIENVRNKLDLGRIRNDIKKVNIENKRRTNLYDDDFRIINEEFVGSQTKKSLFCSTQDNLKLERNKSNISNKLSDSVTRNISNKNMSMNKTKSMSTMTRNMSGKDTRYSVNASGYLTHDKKVKETNENGNENNIFKFNPINLKIPMVDNPILIKDLREFDTSKIKKSSLVMNKPLSPNKFNKTNKINSVDLQIPNNFPNKK